MTPSEDVLAKFNNEPLEVNNGFYDADKDSTISVLFLGNSITMTGVPDELTDKTPRGLTASGIDKDYVHKLLNKVACKKNVNIDYSIANIAEFERGFTFGKFDIHQKLINAKNLSPDILIVQIGENVKECDIEDPKLFYQEYISLLNEFPEAMKIITIPFWPSKNKQKVITRVALDTESYLVDLSHLGNGTDKDNFASSERHYSHLGVGSHPGDYGMSNIADAIFTVINATR